MKKLLALLLPLSLHASQHPRIKAIKEEREAQRKQYFMQLASKNMLEMGPKQEQRKPLPVNIPIRNVEVIRTKHGIIIVEE